MSRTLKLSGFLGLAVQAVWGMANVLLLMPMGPTLAGEPMQITIGAHAHFGVLGILAIALGFALDHYDVRGSRRTRVIWTFIPVQWLLPATFLAIAFVSEMAGLITFLWGILLLVSMGTMTRVAWTEEVGPIQARQ
jgi:hypothetical protein